MAKRGESKAKANVIVKAAKNGQACYCCAKPVGDAAKVWPMRVTQADGGPCETWCPTCFVWKRAAMEPGRWQAAAPLLCADCGFETVSLRGLVCTRCKSRKVLIAGPTQAAIA